MGWRSTWRTWRGSSAPGSPPELLLLLPNPQQACDILAHQVAAGDHEEGQQRREGEAEDDWDLKRADLNKMHCYRDAILGTRGAYVLYPGSAADVRHIDPYVRKPKPPNRGPGLPSVGAFRLRPGCEKEHTDHLRKMLAATVSELLTAEDYGEETGTRTGLDAEGSA